MAERQGGGGGSWGREGLGRSTGGGRYSRASGAGGAGATSLLRLERGEREPCVARGSLLLCGEGLKTRWQARQLTLGYKRWSKPSQKRPRAPTFMYRPSAHPLAEGDAASCGLHQSQASAVMSRNPEAADWLPAY